MGGGGDNARMELAATLLDFVLHVDRYLELFVSNYGQWVYALLFLIIFVETGLVVMPFLPGDSLLFVVGAMCGVGLMDYSIVVPLLLAAAVLGNQTNYTIGRYFGARVFQWEDSRFFNKAAFDQAHAFYERYGGITLVAARFMPFARTFAPFVGGVAHMTRAKFTEAEIEEVDVEHEGGAAELKGLLKRGGSSGSSSSGGGSGGGAAARLLRWAKGGAGAGAEEPLAETDAVEAGWADEASASTFAAMAQPGRPNLGVIFKDVADQARRRSEIGRDESLHRHVTAMVCGPTALIREVERLSLLERMDVHSEVFHF